MVRLTSCLLVAALAATVFAGCAAAPTTNAPLETKGDVFTRSVSLDIDGNHPPAVDTPEAVMALAKTTFTYTEPKGGFAVAGVIVTFTSTAGLPVSQPLSAYTTKTTLAKGDKVAIPGAVLSSDIRFTSAGKVVAQRVGLAAAWLKVSGYPIPLAAKSGAAADYDISASGQFGLSFDRAGMTQQGQNQAVKDFKLDGDYSVSGTAGLSAQTEASALKVSFQADVKASGKLDVTAKVEDPSGPSGAVGAKLTGEGTASGQGDLFFKSGELSAYGGSGHVTADATAMIQNPGDSSYSDALQGAHHPLLDETSPYQKGSDISRDTPLAAIKDVLNRIYGITLVPGDTFHAGLTYGSADIGFSVDGRYDLTVAARQAKSVEGKDRSALKMQGSYAMGFSAYGKPQEAHAQQFTYFVDAETLLPLLLESESIQSYATADLAAIFDVVHKMAPDVTLPTDIHFQITTKSSVKLTHIAPGFQTAAIGEVGTLAMPLAFVTVIGGATSFVLMTKMSSGGSTMDRGEDAAVSMTSPSAGKIYITIVKGGMNAPYNLDDAMVTLDSAPCFIASTAGSPGMLKDSNKDSLWGVGETVVLGSDCSAMSAGDAQALASGTTHLVSVSLANTIISDNQKVVIR